MTDDNEKWNQIKELSDQELMDYCEKNNFDYILFKVVMKYMDESRVYGIIGKNERN